MKKNIFKTTFRANFQCEVAKNSITKEIQRCAQNQRDTSYKSSVIALTTSYEENKAYS